MDDLNESERALLKRLDIMAFKMDAMRRVLGAGEDEALEDAVHRVVAERDYFRRKYRKYQNMGDTE